MAMEILVGIGIWILIFVIWYVRNYPDKFKTFLPARNLRIRWPSLKRKGKRVKQAPAVSGNFKSLVETVESICARDKFLASDAATLVEAVHRLLEIESGSGHIWEAYALDSLETAQIVCDDCRVSVDKIVKKTGVRIQCPKCMKWLVLKNSKVTVIDPTRPDLEEWEKFH
ncbi:MAG: hypothetical protein AB1733_08160 [Thermodesulfobacteriota bacterium]